MFIRKIDAPWLRFVTDGEDGGGVDVESVDDPQDVTADDDATDVDDTEDDVPLGPSGERALEAVKAKERATRAELRALKAEIAALKTPKEGDETPEQVRERIRQDVAREFNERLVRAEVKATASAMFADPEDAVAFLNVGDFDIDADGNVDASDIEDALKDLLARKPHLAKQGGAQSSTKRRIPEVPADPARSQSTPLTLQDKIAAAQKAGDFKAVISLQNELLEVS